MCSADFGYGPLARAEMHYMTGPDHETLEQLRPRLCNSTQGLPPIIETRHRPLDPCGLV